MLAFLYGLSYALVVGMLLIGLTSGGGFHGVWSYMSFKLHASLSMIFLLSFRRVYLSCCPCYLTFCEKGIKEGLGWRPYIKKCMIMDGVKSGIVVIAIMNLFIKCIKVTFSLNQERS